MFFGLTTILLLPQYIDYYVCKYSTDLQYYNAAYNKSAQHTKLFSTMQSSWHDPPYPVWWINRKFK